MSLTIAKDFFLEGLQKAYPLIPLKSSLQILSNFRIVFNGSCIEITATDLDQSLNVQLPCEGPTEKSFDITVNARKFFELIRELPPGSVSLSVQDNVIMIVGEKKFTCKIAGADSNDFPGFPDIPSFVEVDVNSSIFKVMVPNSSFAVAKDESRACLSGILWELYQDKTGMVATDGHRLGSCFIHDSFSLSENISCIVSPKILSNLMRNIDTKKDARIKVRFGEKYIVFIGSCFTLYSKIIEGPYPDYSKVIPQNNPKEAIVARNDLLNATKRASILSNQKTHLIKVVFSQGTLEVMVVNREIGGEAKETIDADYSGDTHAIGFNAQYFTEILEILKTEKVRITMNTQISACLLHPVYEKPEEKTSEDLFLIMPLRIMDS